MLNKTNVSIYERRAVILWQPYILFSTELLFYRNRPEENLRIFPNGIISGIKQIQLVEDIAVEIEEKAKEVGGHGGMDFIMDYRLIYCLQHGLPLDQDVYDAAEWSCLGELTAASIANGGMPVQMPDFTRGDWNKVQGYRHAK